MCVVWPTKHNLAEAHCSAVQTFRIDNGTTLGYTLGMLHSSVPGSIGIQTFKICAMTTSKVAERTAKVDR